MPPNDKQTQLSVVAIATFSSLVVALTSIQKWKQIRRRRHLLGSSSNKSDSGIDSISVRGQSFITPTMPYIIDYLKCLQVNTFDVSAIVVPISNLQS